MLMRLSPSSVIGHISTKICLNVQEYHVHGLDVLSLYSLALCIVMLIKKKDGSDKIKSGEVLLAKLSLIGSIRRGYGNGQG